LLCCLPMLRKTVRTVVVGTALFGMSAAPSLLLLPRAAQACGGFFCNAPDNPFTLPVAQTAENVLFAMERDPSGQFKLEAHVQIFYTGPADKFSWVVPVDNLPTVDVGSNAVFTALLNATQPRFQLDWKVSGICKPVPGVPMSSGSSGSGGSSASPTFDAAASADAGVTVAFRGDVGPYDAAVIKSDRPDDPTPLLTWLRENKYDVTPEGERLIEDYVKQEKYFVAIKLLSQAGVNEIQPLVMRFLGPGPCVPLKLTSIAAIRDLKVNLWVLADQRIVPDNFFEIVINEARINWFQGGSNYEQLVKEAANEAGGNAFVTEYVGPTAMLKGQVFVPFRYELSGVRQAQTPPQALASLGNFPRDASLLNVLRTHIPVPASIAATGITEQQFYNQLSFYWDTQQAAFKPFSGTAFADDLEKKIVDPLRKAQALFDNHAKLTRLSTFISPEEMTLDPTFVRNPSLPDVPAARLAQATMVCGNQEYTACTAPVLLELKDGTGIWYRPEPQPVCWGRAQAYGRADLDDLPAMTLGYARTSQGEGLTRFDNTAKVREAVLAHNRAVASAAPLPPMNGTGGAGGTPGGSAGGTGGGGTGGNSTTPTDPNGVGGSSSGTKSKGGGSGCGCAVPGSGNDDVTPGVLFTVLALAGIGWRRFRRRA
jgi:MYXO-CTERM domain-containing protein